ncbi:four helix bundle protein [Ignavibacteria bacterium 4148-Me]|uniref:four helix bundle protein n=1 Tax=Rosettibacter primus TaxID=3111523 RepID=UPI00336BB632
MKEDNIIKQKSYNFALKIIDLFQSLKNEREYVISKQLLRSGTSIGANIEEAIGGQSRKDFFMKINIAYKEARETNYWLKLLKDSNLIELRTAESLINECDEILKILGTIIKTMKQSSNGY